MRFSGIKLHQTELIKTTKTLLPVLEDDSNLDSESDYEQSPPDRQFNWKPVRNEPLLPAAKTFAAVANKRPDIKVDPHNFTQRIRASDNSKTVNESISNRVRRVMLP